MPEQLHVAISAAFAASDYADDLKDLRVAFNAASASSLDYLIYASMNGNSAASYFVIERLIQQTCVDICNQQGWIIPFTQVTLHQAENSAPTESPQDTT